MRLAALALAMLVAAAPPAAKPAKTRAERTKPGATTVVAPASVALDAARLARIDGVVEEAIARKELPGAVVVVGRHGKIAFEKAYGFRALVPEKEPMTADTVFDMASLTKPVATASSVMTLVEAGKIRLSDPVVKHLPAFGAGGGLRDKVTVQDLLTHRAGLPPDDPMELYTGTPDEIFEKSFAQPLASTPGEKFVYSDVGYEVLAEIVRKVSGAPLDVYAKEHVFAPLGMTETEFRRLGKTGSVPIARIAPTEMKDGKMLRGEVHDPHAYALGGVAGHAGLFSTARDLARFADAMLGRAPTFLSPAGIAAMTRPYPYGDPDLRGLGWDIATPYASSRGELFPLGSFGHTGWTGTSLWIDPTTDTYLIVLSNRNHPDGAGNVVPLRARLATIVASAITDVTPQAFRAASQPIEQLLASLRRAPAPSAPAATPAAAPKRAPVLAGVDVLASQSFAPIAGKRVAIVTNQSGRAKDGRTTAEVLTSPEAKRASVRVVRLFSPEHGFAGKVDEKVPDGRDEATGLPVRSLYWDARRPAAGDLADVDAIVVDLQDAGVRFYTYLATMGYLMEEAAKAHVAVVVLDRPNPIRAISAAGPLADADALGFNAYHTIPVVTGMTIGELALLFDAEKKLGAKPTVVKMTNYRRDLWYDETGLAWVNPSPNLRSVTEAALYPGVALIERTNVSVGRGTATPFEVVGAPFVDGNRLASSLNARHVPGVAFAATVFTPTDAAHAGKMCNGVKITLTDRNALDPMLLGFTLAATLRDLYPKEWELWKVGDLLANRGALTRLKRGDDASSIVAGFAADLMEFSRRRAPFLLY